MLLEIKKEKTELVDIKLPLITKDRHINRYRKLTQAGLLSIHFGNSHAIRFEKMDLDNRWLIGDIEEMLKEEIIPDVVFICQLEKTLESLTTNF